MTNINRTQTDKPGQSSAPGAHGANNVLPLFAAVLNKLQSLGVRCEVRADDGRRSLIIEVIGATTERTTEGRTRFVMRQAPAPDRAGEV